MSFNSAVQDIANGVATFWIRAAKQFVDARTKATAGTLSADELARSAVKSAGDIVDLWMKVLPFPPAPPVAPTVLFSDVANAYVNASPTRHASLSFSVPSGAVVQVTDLMMLGAAGSIPSTAVAAVVADTEVDVTITVGGTAPTKGLYEGIAYYGTPPVFLVRIVVRVM